MLVTCFACYVLHRLVLDTETILFNEDNCAETGLFVCSFGFFGFSTINIKFLMF